MVLITCQTLDPQRQFLLQKLFEMKENKNIKDQF